MGWAAAWALLLMAAGGAADAQGAVLLGAPSLLAAAGATLGIAALALATGVGAGGALVGLAPLVLALLLASPLAGLRALTGPPLFAIVAAGAVLALARAGRRPPAAWFLPAVLVLLHRRVLAGAGPGRPPGRRAALPDGRGQPPARRRPVARAGLRARAATARSTRSRCSRTTACAAATAPSIRCTRVGLSLLILPAYALGGYPAVSFFMAGSPLSPRARCARWRSEWTGEEGGARAWAGRSP